MALFSIDAIKQIHLFMLIISLLLVNFTFINSYEISAHPKNVSTSKDDHMNFYSNSNIKTIHSLANIRYGDHTLQSIIVDINNGNRMINDMCEMMEERVGFLTGSDKPNCRFNASFISNNSITLFDIGENVREFFLKRKRESCKEEKLECGELTIMLKLIDLINSIVHIALKVNSIEEFMINLKTISFQELFVVYTTSLENYEILSNITLRKQRANIILERERSRLATEANKGYLVATGETISVYIGVPIKGTFRFIGTTLGGCLGGLLGSTIEGTSSTIGISVETKIILAVLVVIFVIKK